MTIPARPFQQSTAKVYEITSGSLICLRCKAQFPILAGVALVVDDVQQYLIDHVKGISKRVCDSEIPERYRSDYLESKAEIQSEHIESDLEADRVNALYLMNHYLRVEPEDTESHWWKPATGGGSAVIDSLIRAHWNHGPFEQIGEWVSELSKAKQGGDAVELGCGVGGLYPLLRPLLNSYLGVDSSFAGIALARHLALGMPYRGTIRIPEDLLNGPVSRKIKMPIPKAWDGQADFIVGDFEGSAVKTAHWDLAIALNTIDMMDEPFQLAQLQYDLLKKGGVCIQSCPYIWFEGVARKLRAELPKEIRDSARAVEWLYEKAGFKLEMRKDELTWLFFKHVRQMEIYSVHLFAARKV